ncbi:hypothetical protein ACFE04_000948 [Oxalis oulophora]
MGVCLSAPRNQVKSKLSNSAEFNSACDSAFDHCLSLTQHAFPGVFSYQLPTAASHIHQTLTTTKTHPLIVQWVPSPPTRSQIDSALRVTTQLNHDDDREVIGLKEFKEWATVLFAEAVVDGAGKAAMKFFPIGAVGIAGIGAVTRTRKASVGLAIGGYASGLATVLLLSLYLSK